MIFCIPYIVSFVSDIMTLHPGDVILTGTPSGVGPLKGNYKVMIEIEQIGSLINSVSKELKLKKRTLLQESTKSVYSKKHKKKQKALR